MCDVPMQWHSTLQMLERLYEQRKAVDDYVIHQATNVMNLGFVEPSQWQLIRDACHLLKPFEEANRFVTWENCGMNDVIPLIFILEKALTLMQQGEEEGDVQCLTRCHVGETFRGDSAQEEIKDDEEGQPFKEEGHPFLHVKEAVMSLPTQDEATHLSSRCASGEHDADKEGGLHWVEGNVVPMGSETMTSMAGYMLTCLQSDKHITDIKQRDDYWVATLLDPRYKSKMGKFFEASEMEAKLTLSRYAVQPTCSCFC